MNLSLQDDKMFNCIIENNIYGLTEAFKNGANIHAKDNNNEEALEVAARTGKLVTLELLLTKGAIDHHDDYNEDIATRAADRASAKCEGIFQNIFERIYSVLESSDKALTLLERAFFMSNEEINTFKQEFLSLIKSGVYADIRARIPNRSTALMLVSRALECDEKYDLINQLLNKGGDINAIDKEWNSVLSYASENLYTVEFLIKKGAKVDKSFVVKYLLEGNIKKANDLLSYGQSIERQCSSSGHPKTLHHHTNITKNKIIEFVFLQHLENFNKPTDDQKRYAHAMGVLLLELYRTGEKNTTTAVSILNIKQLLDVRNINNIDSIKSLFPSLSVKQVESLYEHQNQVSAFTHNYFVEINSYLKSRLTQLTKIIGLKTAKHLDQVLHAEKTFRSLFNPQTPNTFCVDTQETPVAGPSCARY